MRILFVDDDPALKESLEAALCRQRGRPELVHDDGKAVDSLLEWDAFDAVIVSAQLRAMDGLQVLGRARVLQPGAARIAIETSDDHQVIRNALEHAHQVVKRAADATALGRVVVATTKTVSLLDARDLRMLAGAADQLPVLPDSFARFQSAMAADASMSEVAKIVESDPVLTARTLRLVNSAFFRLSAEVKQIDRAISVLGYDTLQSLVLQAATTASFESAIRSACFDVRRTLSHSIQVADLAARMLEDKAAKMEARTIGVVHGVGQLVLAWRRPFVYRRAMRVAKERGMSLAATEVKFFRHTHADVGAYLLGLWGLPFSLVHAVAHHQWPSASEDQDAWGPLGAVHIANALLTKAERDTPDAEIDWDYLRRVGMDDHMDEWRTLLDSLEPNDLAMTVS